MITSPTDDDLYKPCANVKGDKQCKAINARVKKEKEEERQWQRMSNQDRRYCVMRKRKKKAAAAAAVLLIARVLSDWQ